MRSPAPPRVASPLLVAVAVVDVVGSLRHARERLSDRQLLLRAARHAGPQRLENVHVATLVVML